MSKGIIVVATPFMAIAGIWVLCRIYDAFAWLGLLPVVGN